MNSNKIAFVNEYIANVQLDLSVAAYTKVPTTWHDDDYTPEFNKLYFIVEGEGYVKIRDQTFFPTTGDLYLLPAGTVQSYGTLNRNTFGKYWCHFRARIGHVDLFQMLNTSTFIHTVDGKWLERKFKELIYWHHHRQLTSKMHVHATLLQIIAFFVEHCEEVNMYSKTTDALARIDHVLKYIEDHLSEKLSIKELAEIAHFHPNYLIRIFKNATGFSPIHYINRMKIERAKHMLRFSDVTVLRISDSLGMNIAYFSRMFKEYTGFSPTDYRDLLTNGSEPDAPPNSTPSTPVQRNQQDA